MDSWYLKKKLTRNQHNPNGGIRLMSYPAFTSEKTGCNGATLDGKAETGPVQLLLTPVMRVHIISAGNIGIWTIPA
jgi:hypothetical protein